MVKRVSREEKLHNVVVEIYKKMYAESTPPGNWDEMMESGETKTDFFFDNYVLSQERSDAIIEDVIKQYKWIKKYEVPKIKTTIYLGCSPRFNPKPSDDD